MSVAQPHGLGLVPHKLVDDALVDACGSKVGSKRMAMGILNKSSDSMS